MLGEGDALLEDQPGSVVAVKTADCIPILLVDERRRAVAAVHAGWRGTAARIAADAVAAMGERFGTRPEDLHAAIGPGIGACCYEVGPEVAAQFGGQGRGHIDLTAANRRQLEEAGVTPRASLCVEFVHHVPGARSSTPSGATRKRPAACIRLPESDKPRRVETHGARYIDKERRVHVHVDLPAMRTRSSSGL